MERRPHCGTTARNGAGPHRRSRVDRRHQRRHVRWYGRCSVGFAPQVHSARCRTSDHSGSSGRGLDDRASGSIMRIWHRCRHGDESVRRTLHGSHPRVRPRRVSRRSRARGHVQFVAGNWRHPRHADRHSLEPALWSVTDHASGRRWPCAVVCVVCARSERAVGGCERDGPRRWGLQHVHHDDVHRAARLTACPAWASDVDSAGTGWV